MSVILFLIIGFEINAPLGYWIFYGLFCLAKILSCGIEIGKCATKK